MKVFQALLAARPFSVRELEYIDIFHALCHVGDRMMRDI